MSDFLLSVHVLAAILAIGPVAVAASMFPRSLRQARARTSAAALPVLRTLARICRVYAGLGVLVPVFGLATALSMGVLGDAWLMISIALTAVAAAVLVGVLLPGQRRALAAVTAAAEDGPAPAHEAGGEADPGRAGSRLAMATGVFNLLWAVVVVLMIVRPGATHAG